MNELLRWVLPLYFLVYFGLAFVLKSITVARRTGKNPLVLPKDDSAAGLIGLYFKGTFAALLIYLVLFSVIPDWHPHFLPIVGLEHLVLKYIGLGLMAVALAWTVIAQWHMKDAWRIGLDTENQTGLVTTGVFGLSRNPVFLGMIMALVGLFLVTPNACAALIMIVGCILIQIQIRLEEAFLTAQHGAAYLSYRQKVRRFL